MSDDTLYPTHTCFDDVLDFLENMVKAGKGMDAFRFNVVHGICTTAENEPYSHAWLESLDGEEVSFSGFLRDEKVMCTCPRSDFYETLGVQECTKYTVDEAISENHRSGNYGPWVPKYIELTKNFVGPRQLGRRA